MSDDLKQMKLRRLAHELDLARDRERKQIARELHDNIGQSLAFMRMKLTSLRGDVVFSGFDKNVDEILLLLDQTIRNTRTLCFEISPPVLHELGLTAALGWLAERFDQKHGLKVSVVEKHPLPPRDEALSSQLFSNIRELLVNVVKYAQATRTTITLDKQNGLSFIEVADDGVGFDATRIQSMPDDEHGFGLFNIREQLDYAGGHLECHSSPGKGSRIRMVLPKLGA